MTLRIPPGRAGRTWLTRRLETGRRGSDVLAEKRRALLRERERLQPLVAAAEAEWMEAASDAAVWLSRAVVLSGGHRLRLAQDYAGPAPTITVEWHNALGVEMPGEPQLDLAPTQDATRVGGSAALAVAEERHRGALVVAARHAALRMSLERVTRELERTTHRLRAIERRWLPMHERALSALELALDEAEREDTARTRWAGERTSGSR